MRFLGGKREKNIQEQMHGNNACPIKQFSVWMPIELAASRQPSPEASSSPGPGCFLKALCCL
jgi:hypothetical protein